jgi:hypothetical protein
METFFSQLFLQYAKNKMITTNWEVVKNKIQSNFSYKISLQLKRFYL